MTNVTAVLNSGVLTLLLHLGQENEQVNSKLALEIGSNRITMQVR